SPSPSPPPGRRRPDGPLPSPLPSPPPGRPRRPRRLLPDRL
ncbi:hypothetical protein EE612_056363, partial [Oryza sativa]